MAEFKNIHYERDKVEKKSDVKKADISFLNEDAAKKVKHFHESFDVYKETPLRQLNHLADKLGIKSLYIKDESYRFGLNAFKVLGGSYAIGNYLAHRLEMDIDELPYMKMISDEIKAKLGDITFVTATDGNHGRGVAWTAHQLKQKSVVYMPKGSSKERLQHILDEGAQASITELNYDDAVRLANEDAKTKGYVMVQDTAWEGYTDIPTWIMQGYMTMAYEAYLQLKDVKPTHIFIQAGVGSLAGAVQGFFANAYGEDRPILTVVEPHAADCMYRSAAAKDGKRRIVTGEMNTIMAGLACGEPNTIGWEILRDYTDNFVSCPDYTSAQGMRVLAHPIKEDEKVISGESGAVGMGLVNEVMTDPKLNWLKETLKLDENSVVLCFSSEGNTDKASYQHIVCEGAYPRED